MARLSERRKEMLNAMMQDAIHVAAVAVLTEHGISGLTMDRVAEKAEVAKGSLYKYFPNKAALVRFVHQRAIEPLVRAGQEVLESPLPARQKLETLLHRWLEYLDQHRGLFSFFVLDSTVRGMLQREQQSGHALGIQYLVAVIQQGIEERLFRPIDPNWAAILLFGAVRQMCEQRLGERERWPVARESREAVDFFLLGLQSGPQPSES